MHCYPTYLFAVIFNNYKFNKRESKLPKYI